MRKLLLSGLIATSVLFANNTDDTHNFDPKSVEHITIKMDLLNSNGKNTPVGEVVAINTPYGVAFYPNLKGLPVKSAGQHGFHVHVNPDCGLTDKGNGMKAGGHWDPKNTKKHSFPWDDNGHKGDLPALFVTANGDANYPVLAPKIKNINELKDHSLMVHVGGDNHSDHPAALGGGGARMICGVIK